MSDDNLNISKEIIEHTNSIKLENKKTSLKKLSFIKEIKSGLGEEIKEKPNEIEYVKPPRVNPISRFFKRLLEIF